MTDTKVRPGTISVVVERDPMTHVPKSVWPWEVPILQAKWPGKLVIGAFKPAPANSDAELPDAEEEYARLEKVCGIAEDTKLPYVAEAFGRGEAGIDRLAEAIESSWEPPKPRVSKKKADKDADGDGKPDEKPPGKPTGK